MKSKYITIKILEDLIKVTQSLKIKNLCRKTIFNIKINQKDEIMNDYMKKNILYLLYENDPLYKFIK